MSAFYLLRSFCAFERKRNKPLAPTRPWRASDPMVRRSGSQFRIDDRAYPVRVKFVVPEGGMRTLAVDPQAWLRENLGHLAWAWGPAQGLCADATAYYF